MELAVHFAEGTAYSKLAVGNSSAYLLTGFSTARRGNDGDAGDRGLAGVHVERPCRVTNVVVHRSRRIQARSRPTLHLYKGTAF